MPQMSPMMWMFIFFYTMIILFISISLIYFIKFTPALDSLNNYHFKKLNLSNWFWMW